MPCAPHISTRAVLVAITAASSFLAVSATEYSQYAQDLLDQSMDFMDRVYDPEAGYLFNLYYALQHETRSSSWYAAGLLARNTNDDVEQAVKIIGNIIEPQFKNASEQWYGDYQSYPEEPYPGTEAYPAVIYSESRNSSRT